jgi:hypothetical protein
MSAGFKIEWEWLANGQAAVRSHGLTWSRLVIRGESQVVTRVIDERMRSWRDGVFVPLMPLAEWIAANWWFLFEEAPPPTLRRASPREELVDHRAWFRRHNLLSAREGHPLPDLTFASGDDDVTLSLRPDDRVYANAPVRFIESGAWLVSREVLSSELRQLTDAVVDRLGECEDVDAVALRNLWKHRMFASGEEALLAQRAAALGLDGDDPDAVSDALADTLLEIGRDLPEALFREALVPGGDEAMLRHRIDQLRIARARDVDDRGDALRRAREEAQGCVEVLPYRQGWSLARRFRERVLGVDSSVYGSALDDLLSQGALLSESDVKLPDTTGLLGWVDASAEGRARCVLAQRSTSIAARFLRARALGSALLGRRERLLTQSATRTQRLARAFATELLAPADAVRAMLPAGWVDDDAVNDIARRLGVSPLVVQHQIENQRLAPDTLG